MLSRGDARGPAEALRQGKLRPARGSRGATVVAVCLRRGRLRACRSAVPGVAGASPQRCRSAGGGWGFVFSKSVGGA